MKQIRKILKKNYPLARKIGPLGGLRGNNSLIDIFCVQLQKIHEKFEKIIDNIFDKKLAKYLTKKMKKYLTKNGEIFGKKMTKYLTKNGEIFDKK